VVRSLIKTSVMRALKIAKATKVVHKITCREDSTERLQTTSYPEGTRVSLICAGTTEGCRKHGREVFGFEKGTLPSMMGGNAQVPTKAPALPMAAARP